MSDLISREAAIASVQEQKDYYDQTAASGNPSQAHIAERMAAACNSVLTSLRDLPAAQLTGDQAAGDNPVKAFKAWTKAHPAKWHLGAMVVDGKFSHFMSADTDNAWMGFCAAWAAREAEVAQLTAERDSANAAFDAGRAFHDLVVKERDLARHQLDKATARAEKAEAEAERYLWQAKNAAADALKGAEAERSDRIEQLERDLIEARDDARDFSALASELTGKLEAERALGCVRYVRAEEAEAEPEASAPLLVPVEGHGPFDCDLSCPRCRQRYYTCEDDRIHAGAACPGCTWEGK